MSKRKQTEKKSQALKIARTLSIEEAKTEIMKEVADRLEHILPEEEEDNTSKNTLEDLDSINSLGEKIKEIIGATLKELKDSLSGTKRLPLWKNKDKKSSKH